MYVKNEIRIEALHLTKLGHLKTHCKWIKRASQAIASIYMAVMWANLNFLPRSSECIPTSRLSPFAQRGNNVFWYCFTNLCQETSANTRTKWYRYFNAFNLHQRVFKLKQKKTEKEQQIQLTKMIAMLFKGK